MKSYISVNVVSQALILLAAIHQNNCCTLSDINQLKLPYGVNRATARSFLEQCDWLKSYSETDIRITLRGFAINAQFNGYEIDAVLWRHILTDYITVCNPAWSKRIPYGRKEAYLIMNTEEQRCFDEADLMTSTSSDVIEWWDSLAADERKKKNASLEHTGRLGELLTIRYEEMRTGVIPVWVAVESNLAGYDILSQQSNDCNEKLLIEVKTSTDNKQYASCIITRHEWDMAQMANNLDRYYFYLWCICGKRIEIARIKAREMMEFIPIDTRDGKWQEALIPYSGFYDSFQEVHPEQVPLQHIVVL